MIPTILEEMHPGGEPADVQVRILKNCRTEGGVLRGPRAYRVGEIRRLRWYEAENLIEGGFAVACEEDGTPAGGVA